MTKINTYLTFSGDCREAMTFYQECLGGDLTLQKIGESPLAEKMPSQINEYILHAALTNGDLLLMGSDMVPEPGLTKGNSVSLALACSSENEIRQCFEKLSTGGQTTHPLENTFFGSIMGSLTDKFGNHWLLNYDKGKIPVR